MSSLFGQIKQFARSPQGRRLVQQAKQAAKDPKNKEKLRHLSDQAKRAAKDPHNKAKLQQALGRFRKRH